MDVEPAQLREEAPHVERHNRELDEVNRQLREANARFQAIWDQGLFAGHLDLEGNILDVNRASVEGCGFTREEMIGKPFWECGWWNRSPAVQEWVQNAIAQALSGEPFRGDSPYFLGDGTERITDFAAMPIKDAASRVILVVVTGMDITERVLGERNRLAYENERQRAAELARLKSEEHFRLLFERAGYGIFVSNPKQQRFVDASEAACRMIGYTREELLGLTYTDLLASDELPCVDPELARLANGAVAMSEWRMRRKDGTIIVIEVVSRHLPDGRVQGIARDITERKRTEKQLFDSERQLRAMVDSIDQLAWIARADGWIYWYNLRWYDYTGTSPAEMAGWGWQSVHDPQILPEVMEKWTASIRTATPFDMVFPLRGADGIFRPFLTRVNPLFDPEGKVLKWFGTSTDIDAIRRAEASVREAEDRFRHLADNIPQMAWIAEPGNDGQIQWFNENWYRYTGTTPEEMKASGWHGLPHPDDAQRVIRKFTQHVEAGLDWEDTFQMRRHDGQYRWFLSRMKCIRDSGGKVIRCFGTNTDITEQREIEQKLTRASQDLESFAYSASHDLQEPLRMITSYSQMLVKGFRGQLGGEAEMCVGYIEDGTRRMRELLADLLAYIAMDVNPADRTGSVDLGVIIQEVCRSLEVAIAESGAVVTSGPLPVVHGNRSHFLQLFQNLISNAIKYRLKSAPLINVTAEKWEGGWRFAVSDNGIGIAPQHHEKVFGVFKRLHGRTIPGTGIGLAICQRVVERYNGRIWVESELEKGATFYFTMLLTSDASEDKG